MPSMPRHAPRPVTAVLLLTLAGPAALAAETADLGAVQQIKDEGLHRSKVMEYASYLTDVYGPRLTGSPALRSAAEYTVKAMREAGLSNPRLELWGPFGR